MTNTTTQRDWHTIKSGDVIFFATGWYEVFDAYLIAKNTMVVKIRLPGGHLETHRIRINAGSRATCRN